MTRFQATCIDRQTGDEWLLNIAADSAIDASEWASTWGFITTPPSQTAGKPAPIVKGQTFFRGGHPIPADLVSSRRHIEDLDALVPLLEYNTHPVDRHFLLQSIAELAHKERDRRPDALKICLRVCWQWLAESSVLVDAMRTEFPDPDRPHQPHVVMLVPKRLVLVTKRQGHRQRAAEIAQLCLGLNLKAHDTEWLRKEADR